MVVTRPSAVSSQLSAGLLYAACTSCTDPRVSCTVNCSIVAFSCSPRAYCRACLAAPQVHTLGRLEAQTEARVEAEARVVRLQEEVRERERDWGNELTETLKVRPVAHPRCPSVPRCRHSLARPRSTRACTWM